MVVLYYHIRRCNPDAFAAAADCRLAVLPRPDSRRAMLTTPSLADAARAAAPARPRAVSNWLLAVAALVLLMVVVGGITRLTESGLSMVRWEPVSGIVPPLTEADWQAEFAAYKAYPEYQQVNRGMDLAAFKRIYFWEYVHRLLGRVIGLAFALPLAWFAFRRAIPRGYGLRLGGLLLLGGLQGAIGWWMVASGLVDRPDVAHERLAVHLCMALLILAALLWTALDLRALATGQAAASRPRRWFAPAALLLFAQITLGAFVAGLNAGYAFNSWPRMGEEFVPDGLWSLAPIWLNLVNNPITVQFAHRWLAAVVAAVLLWAAFDVWRAGRRAAAAALGGMLCIQFLLGVLTILQGVPLHLGVAHQAGAALLVAALVWAGHASARGGR